MTEQVTFEEKIKLLEGDIRNAPSHVFGEHAKCNEIKYFKCSPPEDEVNLVPSMKLCGLYGDLEACLQRLIQNCTSLILNMDNNMAEHFNSIVCKFVGGKRVNFSLRGSYQTRCEAAALSFNLGCDYHKKLNEAITGRRPSQLMESYSSKRRRIRLRPKKKFFHQTRRKMAVPDKDYGPEANIQPLSLEDKRYKELEEEFLKKLKKTPEEIDQLEKATIGQSGNPIWIQERSYRITASHFGQICKMRPTTPCTNTVKNLLYSKFTGNQATRYGIANEVHAKQAIAEHLGVEIENCGLFIDYEHFYLGATPDGLIAHDSIIEIKCPSVLAKTTPKEGIINKKITYAALDGNDNLYLKRNHAYYYQVQGQLAISTRTYCYFCIWSPHGILVEKVNYNENHLLFIIFCYVSTAQNF